VWEEFDPLLRASVEFGEAVTASELVRAQDEVHRLHSRLAEVLSNVDVLLSPTVAGQAPRAGELGTINGDPDVNWVRMTSGFNLTRSPAGSVCAGFTADGLPVGLQVIGGQHDDLGVLRAMAVFEDLLAVDRLAPVGPG
jgi:Asp-tRNA(Asn)/Glu-tRNA(Gln) amidotransferase A subunit family amidase